MSLSKLFPLRRFFRNKDGATAVEFAIISIPLTGFIVASLQTAIIFFEQQALQTAAEQTARQLMTGSAQLSGLSQGQFKTLACGYASTFTCGNLMVDVESSSSFSNLTPATLTPTYNGSGVPTNTWNYSPGSPSNIVILRLMYDWPVIGGPLFSISNQSNGGALLVGTAVFKNEPY